MTTWRLPAELRTERLLLRRHRPGDVDDLLVFHSDPELVRYLPWPVRDRDAVVEFLVQRAGLVEAAEDGQWVSYAVELADEPHPVIGEVLLKRKDAARGVAEVGYALAPSAQGRGLASEAVAAMLDLGATAFGVRTVHATVDERNAASIRLLERFGFSHAGPAEEAGDEPLQLHTLTIDHSG